MNDRPTSFVPRRQPPPPGSRVPHSQTTPPSGGSLEIHSERPAGTPRVAAPAGSPVQVPLPPAAAPAKAPQRPQAPPPPAGHAVVGSVVVEQPDADPATISTAADRLFHPDAQRVPLPSGGLFYGWNELQARPFQIRELAKIARGLQEKNISLLIDAMDATMNRDVRTLTIPDFKFMQYWLRINSYPASPYPIRWTSRYGNENTHTVLMNNLTIKSLEMLPERAASWRERGISPPRVRDMEIFRTEKLSPEDEWLYENAQWMKGSTVAEKIAALEAAGLEVFQAIANFNKEVDYGVTEVFEATDAHFVPAVYLERLREEIAALQRRAELNLGEEFRVGIMTRMQDLQTVFHQLENDLEAGKEVKAESERRRVEIDFEDFLPRLQ